MKQILTTLLALVLTSSISASALHLPRFFADGMVLQQGQRLPVWGWATPGATVSVSLGGKTVKTTVAADGTWKVYLPKQKATSQPQTLTVSQTAGQGQTPPADGGVLTISNVLIGDVYLCSGQSNMELPVRRCMDKVAQLVGNYSNPSIRYLKLPHQYNYVSPNADCIVRPWQDITPQNCGEVSAICYFMARSLQEARGVPIGIINSAVGGTRVEAWMPQQVLADFPAYSHEFQNLKYHQANWPDSVNRAEQQAARQWDRSLVAADTVVGRWQQADYDFSAWPTVDIFSDWSEGKTGSYWFRQQLTLPASAEGQKAIIRVGAIKDADSVFVNGTFVGTTTYQYPPRIYSVPEGVLRRGENTVVVHLIAQQGRPSFTNGKLYQLEVGSDVYPLSRQWQMARACAMPPRPSSTYFVDCPTGLYNAMIAPLADFPLSGILWYQGESNTGDATHYADYLTAMIESWRRQLGRSVPVVIMQLPGYMSRHQTPIRQSGWCDIREQQRQAALRLPKAALAATLDTGEWNDIHPQDKHTAGERAALQMRRLVYGEKDIVAEGPRPLSARRRADGSIVVSFDDGRQKTVTEFTPTWSLTPDGQSLRYCYDEYPVPEIFGPTGLPTPQFTIPIQ